jgi:hypothetical protein
LLFVFASGLEAQTNFSFDVDVSCDDMATRSLVRSFFSRELRELGDVRVSESASPDYRIDVITFIVKRKWTMSVVVTEPFGGNASAGSDAEVAASLAGWARAVDHSLVRGDSIDDLAEEIRQIVVTLNREVLKPLRKEMKKK